MALPQPPEGVLDPKQPWYNAKVGEKTWIILKAKLTGGEAFGTGYSSVVNLTNADADKLIANLKKDPRGYPQMNEGGGGRDTYDNIIAYQKWLEEEYLEKPFRKQVDDKMEEAAIASRLKEIDEERKTLEDQKKEKAKSFISKSSTFRPGKTISLKTTKVSGLIPKRSVPAGLESKISNNLNSESEDGQSENDTNKILTSTLGRLTLNFVQISDNMDKIKEVIENDYKQAKDINKNEVRDYKKRIANRGKKLTKEDLGDPKSNLSDAIKPFIGGFFSGVGGAIRSLAAFNLIEALVKGDYGAAFKSLLGIGITFIPAIGAMIAGAILKSLLKSVGAGAGGVVSSVGAPSRRSRPRGGGGGIGKFGSMIALGTGALALGSAYAASQGDQQPENTQSRLEDLTTEQKGLTGNGLGVITQIDLKKFQELNNKFEKTLDILLVKSTGTTPGAEGGSGPQSNSPPPSTDAVNMNAGARGSVPGMQFDNAGMVSLLKGVGATDEEAIRLAAIGKYESSGDSSATNFKRPDKSYGLFQINMIDELGPARMKEFGLQREDQLLDPVTNAQAALKTLRGSTSGYSQWSTNNKVTQADLEEGRKSLRLKISPPTAAPTPTPTPTPTPRTTPPVTPTPRSGYGGGNASLPPTNREVLVSLNPTAVNPPGGGSSTGDGNKDIGNVDPNYHNIDPLGRLNRFTLGVMG